MKSLLTEVRVTVNNLTKATRSACLIIGVALVVIACGNPSITKTETATADDPRLWCTEDACIIKDFGEHLPPDLVSKAMGRIYCTSGNQGGMITPLESINGRSTRVLIACP